MTRKEAIKICTREKECIQAALDACVDGGHYVSPDGIIKAADYVEAMDMAITALREQEERSKGCGHCLSEINKDMMLAHGFAHCTDCGRRLEEV